MKPTDFAFLLSNFLGKYLNGQRNLSANTVKAYRDTFVLLLTFLKETHALPAERITIQTLDTAIIHEFLHWLGERRGNSVSTQNQRLAAIHAFFKYAQGEIPELMFHCQTILAIPFKRAPKPVVGYLAQSSMKQLLASPDVSTSSGRRDLALLCILYDTGARVSELCDICVRDVRLEEPAVIRLTGKGRKQRYVPIMSNSASVLKGYMDEYGMLHTEHADYRYLQIAVVKS